MKRTKTILMLLIKIINSFRLLILCLVLIWWAGKFSDQRTTENDITIEPISVSSYQSLITTTGHQVVR